LSYCMRSCRSRCVVVVLYEVCAPAPETVDRTLSFATFRRPSPVRMEEGENGDAIPVSVHTCVYESMGAGARAGAQAEGADAGGASGARKV
jgi:hypothetical protein